MKDLLKYMTSSELQGLRDTLSNITDRLTDLAALASRLSISQADYEKAFQATTILQSRLFRELHNRQAEVDLSYFDKLDQAESEIVQVAQALELTDLQVEAYRKRVYKAHNL